MKKVGIVMGSDSDLPILRKTMDTLTELGIPYECHIYSAHRTPEEARAFASSARENGFGVMIAFAGMAAHLAGAVAANTTLPVTSKYLFFGNDNPWYVFAQCFHVFSFYALKTPEIPNKVIPAIRKARLTNCFLFKRSFKNTRANTIVRRK